MNPQDWQRFLDEPGGAGRAGSGITWVGGLGAVKFSGSDARPFLQGYLTCDTTRLSAGSLAPTALCNLKGRVVMNGWCSLLDDQDVLLLLHTSLVERLAAFLRPYLNFSRTELIDLAGSSRLLTTLDQPPAPGALTIDSRRQVYLLDSVDEARNLRQQFPDLDAEAWLAALTSDGIPLVTAAVSETFLPQMLGLEGLGAIDFEKGCYLGQEVVARAQHRGQVKRRLARLHWRGPAAPVAAADITDADGRVQGVVVQSARSAPDGGPLLAVLRDPPAAELRAADCRLNAADVGG